jgi:hypothetical protein
LKLLLFSPKGKEVQLRKFLRDNNTTDTDIAKIISDSILNKKLEHPAIEELLKLDSNNMLQIGG